MVLGSTIQKGGLCPMGEKKEEGPFPPFRLGQTRLQGGREGGMLMTRISLLFWPFFPTLDGGSGQFRPAAVAAVVSPPPPNSRKTRSPLTFISPPPHFIAAEREDRLEGLFTPPQNCAQGRKFRFAI